HRDCFSVDCLRNLRGAAEQSIGSIIARGAKVAREALIWPAYKHAQQGYSEHEDAPPMCPHFRLGPRPGQRSGKCQDGADTLEQEVPIKQRTNRGARGTNALLFPHIRSALKDSPRLARGG